MRGWKCKVLILRFACPTRLWRRCDATRVSRSSSVLYVFVSWRAPSVIRIERASFKCSVISTNRMRRRFFCRFSAFSALLLILERTALAPWENAFCQRYKIQKALLPTAELSPAGSTDIKLEFIGDPENSSFPTFQYLLNR